MEFYIINAFGKKIYPENATIVSPEVNVILLDLTLTNTLLRYKEFIYTGSDLTSMNIWDSPSKVVQYYSISYLYTLGNLTQTVTTRISDSFSYTKTFAYDGSGNLLNINITT